MRLFGDSTPHESISAHSSRYAFGGGNISLRRRSYRHLGWKEHVARAAASLSDGLRDQTWKPVPANTVPTWVTVDGIRVNAFQFLVLMAGAYLDPMPGKKLKIARSLMISHLSGVYPQRLAMQDFGTGWTLKPAILRLPKALPIPVPIPAAR